MKKRVSILILFVIISSNVIYSQHFVATPIEISRGGGSQTSFITNHHNPWIWSTKNGTNLLYPFTESAGLGHLVIQPRTSALRDILFVTGNGDDIRMVVKGNGYIGIGTTNPDMKLTVKGNIHAEEVKIDLSVPAPDYVFENGYNLKTIEELEKYIIENGHLPEIPSAKEFEQNGIMLAEMNMNLLKKIEELTLYTIAQQKKIERLKLLEKRLAQIEKLLELKN
ncbi:MULTISPECIES: tail fiber protein [Flagellimonas]|uniref:Peptidase S74 domain-containing protein n=1 Tax=Flagellimonas hadalis TaxID=2597517 RepID=A0A5N5IMG6_9FLAO|nr:tail fiber protein [Allomuricauda hadalis]KAB5486879.1 hypothetical protein FOT42_012010 [Allomuricauda hadalis]